MVGPASSSRATRVETLRRAHPAAGELIAFYVRVLALQAAVRTAGGPWVTPAASGAPGPRFLLRETVERPHVRVFQRFARGIAPDATPVLTKIAVRLTAERSLARAVLEAFVRREPLDLVAAESGCEVAALVFFPRAFLQPILEAAIGPGSPTGFAGRDTVDRYWPAACPQCGWPPQATVLRDGPEQKGLRTLVCSLCATEWPLPRATCPHCGEADTNQLEHHVAESWPHLRVEACRTCSVYLKAVDCRIDGAAEPLADELASVELDLWAQARGLAKLHSNLLGL